MVEAGDERIQHVETKQLFEVLGHIYQLLDLVCSGSGCHVGEDLGGDPGRHLVPVCYPVVEVTLQQVVPRVLCGRGKWGF